MRRRAAFLFGACGLLALLAGGAAAQEYPTHPVRMIVPYPPAGGTPE